MGALEYKPTMFDDEDKSEEIHVDALAELADEVLKSRTEAAAKLGVRVCLPELRFCGDNAAMIGAQGYYEYLAGNVADMTLNAYATKSILGEAL